MADIDLVNRDPNNLHDTLKVSFEDVLAEPDGANSLDCVWKLSYTCFNLWKRVVYTILTTLFGCCLAAYWGCVFACLAFEQIWVVYPYFRIFEIYCGNFQRIWSNVVSCCMEPVCLSCSKLFEAFRKTG